VDREEALGIGAITVGVSKAASTIVSAGDTSLAGGDDIVPFSFIWLGAKTSDYSFSGRKEHQRVIEIGKERLQI
jgi:hypothetical protein